MEVRGLVVETGLPDWSPACSESCKLLSCKLLARRSVCNLGTLTAGPTMGTWRGNRSIGGRHNNR